MHHVCSQGAKVVNPLDLLRSFSWKPPESHGHLQIFGKWLQWEILNPWLCYNPANPSMNKVNIIFLLLCIGRNLFYSFYLELSFLEQMCVYYHCPCLCFLKVINLSFSIIKSSVLNISWHSWIFLCTLSCKYNQKCMYLQWSAEWEVAICFEFFQFRILGVCVASPVSASSSSLPVSSYIVKSVIVTRFVRGYVREHFPSLRENIVYGHEKPISCLCQIWFYLITCAWFPKVNWVLLCSVYLVKMNQLL